MRGGAELSSAAGLPIDPKIIVGRPALRDFPSDPMQFVGRKPEVRLRRIEDLKRGTNPAKRREAKRHF